MKKVRERRKKALRGQALVEYLILISIIAVGSMAVVQLLASNLNRKLATVSNALGGHSSAKIEGQRSTESHYKIRDLGDFEDAIVDTDRN